MSTAATFGKAAPPWREARVRRRVAAGFGIDHGLQARSRRDQDDRRRFHPRPDHRHVAGVVDDALLLLEGGFMLFIDHDEAEIGKGQEQS